MKKQPLKRLGSFDSLYYLLNDVFLRVADNRQYNASYSLSDMLKAGFAMFSLKCPSLLSFMGMTVAERHNLSSIYHLDGLPSANGLRKCLDGLSPDRLRTGFGRLWKRLRQLGILDVYRYWNRHLIVSVDGVEHFCSKNIHCPHCLSRTHKGETGYHHAMLSAVLVHPGHREVFVMENEPILRQDGQQKNDCERNACKRLLGHIRSNYGKERLLFVMDALYSCAPIVKPLLENPRWQFVIGIRPEGNASLFAQWEGRRERQEAVHVTVEDQEGLHCYGFTNNLALNTSNSEVRVNMIYYELTSKKGKKTTFTWITSVKLTRSNVQKLALAGRSRWKIENETFNTLKNQGYHYGHNYGHGKANLCSVFAFLMMMAFTVDQIQQHACRSFGQLWKGLKTKAKLWENLRAAFKMICLDSMEELFSHLAKVNQIQLE